tara:strand:+ start:546 stop:707 length:162 start_codon:yes stop_codon:yes gene_type:complete
VICLDKNAIFLPYLLIEKYLKEVDKLAPLSWREKINYLVVAVILKISPSSTAA